MFIINWFWDVLAQLGGSRYEGAWGTCMLTSMPRFDAQEC